MVRVAIPWIPAFAGTTTEGREYPYSTRPCSRSPLPPVASRRFVGKNQSRSISAASGWAAPLSDIAACWITATCDEAAA